MLWGSGKNSSAVFGHENLNSKRRQCQRCGLSSAATDSISAVVSSWAEISTKRGAILERTTWIPRRSTKGRFELLEQYWIVFHSTDVPMAMDLQLEQIAQIADKSVFRVVLPLSQQISKMAVMSSRGSRLLNREASLECRLSIIWRCCCIWTSTLLCSKSRLCMAKFAAGAFRPSWLLSVSDCFPYVGTFSNPLHKSLPILVFYVLHRIIMRSNTLILKGPWVWHAVASHWIVLVRPDINRVIATGPFIAVFWLFCPLQRDLTDLKKFRHTLKENWEHTQAEVR